MSTNPDLLALLRRQDGLVTRAQAEQHGLPPRTLSRRVQVDGWNRLAPRVYLAGGHRLTDRPRIRAAGLWAGEEATVSGPAAAWWHGMLAEAPEEVAVTVPRRLGMRLPRRAGAAAGSRPGRPGQRAAPPAHRPAAHRAGTAIAVPDGAVFLDRALQKHVRFDELHRAYCRNMGARGGTGIAALLVAAADRADSRAERTLLRLLRSAAITGWEVGVPFGPWKIDLAFPGPRIAVERFRADRRKGDALVRAGWVVLRFTWHDLTHRPGYVIAEIHAALLAAAATAWSPRRCTHGRMWPCVRPRDEHATAPRHQHPAHPALIT